ncbi:GP158 protein, partial [Sylvietta virens]|nr:GP158 protein [Sylvietta virens]
CRPCRPGCATCEDDTPCLIQEDPVLRAAVLSCQACCMLAIFLSMLVSYHFRRSKASCPRVPVSPCSAVTPNPALPGTLLSRHFRGCTLTVLSLQRIRTSGLILLETILFGSLLLYFPVTGRVWVSGPSQWGGLGARDPIVKGARDLCSGRAWDLPTGVCWGLTGVYWGLTGIPHTFPHHPGRPQKKAAGAGCGRSGSLLLRPTAEMLFLLWGSFLCYATRAVPSAFHEPRYMGIALHNELMVSAAFHLLRREAVGSGGGEGSAVGAGTALLVPSRFLIPPVPAQFLHTGSPLREEITAEVYEDELDMRRSGSCMNSSIASAWSERSLDPDDIREELKKLYRQLEVHKTWRMATNNPHLAKKRSSRRSLARSILRR